MSNLRFALVTFVLMSFWMVLPAGAIATPNADEVVKSTTDQVVERLRGQKAELDSHPERIYEVIHELVVPHFDFQSMSKWVLGSNWKAATDDQRSAFVSQFRTLLVRTYAKALLEYSDEEIRFFPVESDPKSNLVVVRTEVNQPGGGSAIPIQYRMHVSGGEWKVVDVSVDGVSLVSTYRGSFASEIRKSGLDALIAKLSERNEKVTITDTANTGSEGSTTN